MASTELQTIQKTVRVSTDADVTSAATLPPIPGPGEDIAKTNVQDVADGDFRDYKPRNYHRLAEIVSKDKSWGIFRRFDELNMLHLMVLQAEIIELRDLFRDRSRRDDAANLSLDDGLYSGYFHALRKSVPTGDICSNCSMPTPSPYSQLGLLTTLRQRMSEYNELLLQVSQLSQTLDPPKSQLRELQDFLRSSTGGKNFLKGSEAFTWKEPDPSAYLSMNRPSPENDPFTSFLTYRIAYLFHRLCGGRRSGIRSDKRFGKLVDEEAQLRSYSNSKLQKTSQIISVVVSSTLPVVTIFVLNSLDTTTKRLGLTVLFTGVFGILLAFFSSAKRAEIFAATATFAAVEVVFIGTSLPNNGTAAAGGG
ncbi:hypothetical protein V8F33_010608 [Rhypophila sp. PSN 637]